MVFNRICYKQDIIILKQQITTNRNRKKDSANKNMQNDTILSIKLHLVFSLKNHEILLIFEKHQKIKKK